MMILEIATLSIKANEAAEFENIFPKAATLLASAKGYISHQMQRSLDTKGNYVLLIHWQTREDHTIGFCESHLFTQFVALLSPYLNGVPKAEHFEDWESN
jgi:heme-degrading monooxygenase HmoA